MGKDSTPKKAAKSAAHENAAKARKAMEKKIADLTMRVKALEGGVHLREKRIADAVAAYRRRGEMQSMIDGIDGLKKKEKASLYTEAMTRAKGVAPARNPFKGGK